MSEAVNKWMGARKSDRARADGLKPQERAALWKIRGEAKEAGSDLTTGGKGGLPPSRVLGVMRRDKFTCMVCGQLGNMEKNGGLGVHHKGGLENPVSKWLKSKAHSDDLNNLVTICGHCHDNVHDKDRAVGEEVHGE